MRRAYKPSHYIVYGSNTIFTYLFPTMIPYHWYIFAGAAYGLPSAAVLPAVVACYTLPLSFAVEAQAQVYRPCACIRDHNPLVSPYGNDEPCLVRTPILL